jgi:ubiquinone/menaquinone biosynthesis C-methylase UbiE
MLSDFLCAEISKRLLKKRALARSPEVLARLADPVKYQQWRYMEGQNVYQRFFRELVPVQGKDLVDLGCGTGGMSYFLAATGAKTVTGIDVDEDGLSTARETAQFQDPDVASRVEFKLGTERHIPVDSLSIDVVFMFYVVAALTYPKDIIAECQRILRPGGYVCINFCPWYHPYAPSIENLVPIPWCHVIFPEKTLVKTCAELHDWEGRPSAYWDLAGREHGKPNSYRQVLEANKFKGIFARGLTINRFRKIVQDAHFETIKLQLVGFGGKYSKLSRPLVRIPLTREFFTSLVVCVLRKPVAHN